MTGQECHRRPEAGEEGAGVARRPTEARHPALNVAALLPVLLPLKCLADNGVTDVATFWRLYHYYLIPASISWTINVPHLAPQALLATGSLAILKLT